MNTLIRPAPVRRSVTVKVDPQRAFDIFLLGMGKWWPGSHSIGDSPLADVVAEPREGGRWYARLESGTENEWGKVLVWEPPVRAVLAWQITADWRFDPAFSTEVEIGFRALSGGGTEVTLEHRGLEAFGERAEAVRRMIDDPGGWLAILQSFATLADGSLRA